MYHPSFPNCHSHVLIMQLCLDAGIYILSLHGTWSRCIFTPLWETKVILTFTSSTMVCYWFSGAQMFQRKTDFFPLSLQNYWQLGWVFFSFLILKSALFSLNIMLCTSFSRCFTFSWSIVLVELWVNYLIALESGGFHYGNLSCTPF